MYIKIKKRPQSDKYYFYKAISYREGEKIKNKQEYICKLTEGVIFKRPSDLYKELDYLRKQDIYTYLKILTKIQFDILKEEKCTLTN